MGNANSAPPNENTPQAITGNVGVGGVPNVDNDDNSNADGQTKKLTDEESRFTQVYSLGGTRFEIDTQRFLAGDSTDLALICRQSLDFYKTHDNNYGGTANSGKKKNLKSHSNKNTMRKNKNSNNRPKSYIDEIDVNNLTTVSYSNNDQQVIATPIHLLLNVRRASVRLQQAKHPKDDSKVIHRLKFTYDSMCTCSLKLDIYANIHNLNSSNLNSREPVKKLYRAQKIKGEINMKFADESPILDMQEIMNSIRRQNISVTERFLMKNVNML